MKILTKEEEQEHYKYAPRSPPLFGPLSLYLTVTRPPPNADILPQ